MATRTLKRDKVPAAAAHPMAQIADGAMTPVTKTEAPAYPADAKLWAHDLTVRMYQTAETQFSPWLAYAADIIGAPVDHRKSLIEHIELFRDRKRAAAVLTADDPEQVKAARKALATTIVNVSRCATIAKALTAGFDPSPYATNFQGMAAAASQFNGSAAAGGKGRPVKSLKSALADLIAKYKEHETAGKLTDDDKVNVGRLAQFAENLQG